MPTLENDRQVFRFAKAGEDAVFSLDFQRTLRIPDTEQTYWLPPGLGRFPLRHAEDYPSLSLAARSRGGVILPMWQAEAMWLSFGGGWFHGGGFPVAIKVAAGKINAVTGEPWRAGLNRDPQDYMVAPEQPWLDGFAIEPGVIRQFVAMPLGEGYSVEEQLTGVADWGGLQIEVTPLKAEVWQRIRRERHADLPMYCLSELPDSVTRVDCASEMGLGAGGRMRQAIALDTFAFGDWDAGAAQRVFVTLVHSKDWKALTGETAPNSPPTAQEYAAAGLPWFAWYGKDQSARPGSGKFAGVASVAAKFKEKTGATLPNSGDVATPSSEQLGPARGPRPVRSPNAW
jgi:hypothetical protein